MAGRLAGGDATGAPGGGDIRAHYQRLSWRFPDPLARAALEIAILRGKGARKFPQARRLHFTSEALEQISSYPDAAYRAGRYRGYAWAADLGCSVGGDSLALAEAAGVVGVDLDPLRLAMAVANLEMLGLVRKVALIQADLVRSLPLAARPGLALFADPARGEAGRRLHRVEAYRPPLGVVAAWARRFPALEVKVSPGVDLAAIGGYDA